MHQMFGVNAVAVGAIAIGHLSGRRGIGNQRARKALHLGQAITHTFHIAFIGIILILVVAIVYSLIAYTDIRELIPGYPDAAMRQHIRENAMKLDSLEYEQAIRDQIPLGRFGTAAETHERFLWLIKNGQTGLNVAFDLPTQLGLDSDDPMAADEVGRVGMAVDSLADFETAFAPIKDNIEASQVEMGSDTIIAVDADGQNIGQSRWLDQRIRLGTLADYDHPYLTMDPAYEGAVLEVFASLVASGLVYRALKPVHWSI